MGEKGSTGREEEPLKRTIGRCETGRPGPAVILLGGIHGNEPAGVEAQKQLFSMIRKYRLAIRGSILGLRGNISALRERVRFLDEDMNRTWLPGIIDELTASPRPTPATSERREMLQLMKEVRSFTDDHSHDTRVMIDLHSFSSEGQMFSITASDPLHRNLLEGTGIPMIFGIENTLQGTTLRYFQDQGYITVAFEGGQHTNPVTEKNMVAGLLMMLGRTGVIDLSRLPEGIEHWREHIRQQTIHVPECVDLVYQHILEPEDRFQMEPGFRNFQPVKKGEVLASDREGVIEAEYDGFILMPLYQKQGNDGFFIVREC